MTTIEKWAQRGTVRYMSSAYINLDGHTSIDIAREIDANLTLVSFTGTSGNGIIKFRRTKSH